MSRPKGFKQSEKTKQKLREFRLGLKYSEEMRLKMSEALRGRTFSEEYKQKISEIMLEKWQDENFRQQNLESRPRGPNHPRWKGGPERFECVGCGVKISYGSTYCKSCAQTGERNGNWKGGDGFEPYPLEFNEALKRKIRERDDNTCQKCGRLQAEEKVEFGKALSVHHIDHNKKNIDPNKLITLCCRCNSEVNSDPEYWQPFFEQLMEEKLKKTTKVPMMILTPIVQPCSLSENSPSYETTRSCSYGFNS